MKFKRFSSVAIGSMLLAACLCGCNSGGQQSVPLDTSAASPAQTPVSVPGSIVSSSSASQSTETAVSAPAAETGSNSSANTENGGTAGGNETPAPVVSSSASSKPASSSSSKPASSSSSKPASSSSSKPASSSSSKPASSSSSKPASSSANKPTSSSSGNAPTIHTHDYSVQSVKTEATCQHEGEAVYTCDCGASITEVIPKTDHKYGAFSVTTPATTEAPGVETAACTYCGLKTERSIPKLSSSNPDNPDNPTNPVNTSYSELIAKFNALRSEAGVAALETRADLTELASSICVKYAEAGSNRLPDQTSSIYALDGLRHGADLRLKTGNASVNNIYTNMIANYQSTITDAKFKYAAVASVKGSDGLNYISILLGG